MEEAYFDHEMVLAMIPGPIFLSMAVALLEEAVGRPSSCPSGSSEAVAIL